MIQIGTDFLELDWPAEAASSQMGSSFFNAPSGVIYAKKAKRTGNKLPSSGSFCAFQEPSAGPQPHAIRILPGLHIDAIDPSASDSPFALVWNQSTVSSEVEQAHFPVLRRQLAPPVRDWLGISGLSAQHRLGPLPESLPMHAAAVFHPGADTQPFGDLYIDYLSSGEVVVVALHFEAGLPSAALQADYRNTIGTVCMRDPRPQTIIEALNLWAVRQRIIVRVLTTVIAHSPRSVHVQIGNAGHNPAFMRSWNAGPGALKPLGPIGTPPLGAQEHIAKPQVHIVLMQSGDQLVVPGHEFFEGAHFARRAVLDEHHDLPLQVLLPHLLQAGEPAGSPVGAPTEERSPITKEQTAFFLRRDLL